MLLPPWAIFAIAAWLLVFGSFRIAVGLRRRRSDEESTGRRGLLGPMWRRHVIFGAFYILVGTYLVAMGFGYGVPAPSEAGDPVSLPAQRSEHLILE